MSDRKEFLKQLCLLAVAGGGAGALLDACMPAVRVQHVKEGNQLSVRRSDIGDHLHVLVHEPSLPAPVCLSVTGPGEYAAVLMLCTHKSCKLSVTGEILSCPCHGSEFSATGKVLRPPAKENLVRFPVVADDDNVYVDIMTNK